MTFATEFFAVQNALGFENKSMVSSSPFKALDEKFKAEGRLLDISKNLPVGECRAIFVDGSLVVALVNGAVRQIPESAVKSAFGL